MAQMNQTFPNRRIDTAQAARVEAQINEQNAKNDYWRMIRASIGQSSDFFRSLLSRLCVDDYRSFMLSIDGRAWDISDFMVRSFDRNGIMPSAKAFNDQFGMSIRPETGYSQTELEASCTHVEQYVKRQIHAHRLHEMAVRVSADGISARDVAEIQRMLDDGQNGKESVYDPFTELKKQNSAGTFRVFVEELDRLTHGLKKGFVATIAAFAGGFKTTWALNIALRNALAGVHVVYVSFEVAKVQLYAKLWSAYSRCPESPVGKDKAIPFDAIFNLRMTAEQEKLLHEEIIPSFQQKVEPFLTLLDEDDIRATDMDEEEFRQMLYRIDDRRPVDVLVIDHIGMTKYYKGHGNNKARDEFSQINNYVSYFRQLATGFRSDANGIPRTLGVILLCQINRKGYENAVKEHKNAKDGKVSQPAYTMTSIAEANEVEKSSAYIFAVYAIPESGTAVIQLLKNRNGRPKESGASTALEPEYCRFGDTKIVPDEALYEDINNCATSRIEGLRTASLEDMADAFDLGGLNSALVFDMDAM